MDKIVIALLQMEQQIRILHWQTKSFAKHEAFGKTYSALGALIDQFVEVLMGKKGRFNLQDQTYIELVDISEVRTEEFVNATAEMLTAITSSLDPKTDSDLINIRDEILAEINKLKYLLTLQ